MKGNLGPEIVRSDASKLEKLFIPLHWTGRYRSADPQINLQLDFIEQETTFLRLN